MISNRQLSTVYRALRAYFRSGWAFLIPYLAAYLLYAWLKWPVNPAGGGEGMVKVISEGVGALSSTAYRPLSSVLRPPCLLHVYWALHAVHLVLGATALRSWWKASELKLQLSAYVSEGNTPENVGQTHVTRARGNSAVSTGAPSACPPSTGRLPDTVYRLLPWLCLALLFYIPGIYLEWPSDPWEHLRRVIAWSALPTTGANPAGYKSFYFFGYSFLGNLPPSTYVRCLDAYYSGVCLLLAWQYYRLAKAVRLTRSWAITFTLITVLTMGNSCFSFYRYYGIASTMFSQIGAVALIRLALEIIAGGKQLEMVASSRLVHPATTWARLWILLSAALLVALIGYNHAQGLGIAALALASIAVWRIITMETAVRWLMLGIACTLSIAMILVWPRNATIDMIYRPQGWLSTWYGFNLFQPSSPAASRLTDILGWFGLANLAAGVALLARHHIVGWLTVGPVVGLAMPLIALPFANYLSNDNGNYIVAYHRMFFAIPSGLALIVLLQSTKDQFIVWTRRSQGQLSAILRGLPWTFAILILTILVTAPPTGAIFNRTWQLWAIPPTDLTLAPVRTDFSGNPSDPSSQRAVVAAMTANIFVLNVLIPSQQVLVKDMVVRHYENAHRSPIDDFKLANAAAQKAPYPAIYTRPPSAFFTAYSQAAICSGHWSMQVAALASAGCEEMSDLSRKLGLRPHPLAGGGTLWRPP